MCNSRRNGVTLFRILPPSHSLCMQMWVPCPKPEAWHRCSLLSYLDVSSVRLLCLRKLCFGLHFFLHSGCVLTRFGCPGFQMQISVSAPTQRKILTDIIPALFPGQQFAANDVKDRFSGLFELFMIFHSSNSFPLFFPCIQTPCFPCDNNLAKSRLHPNLSWLSVNFVERFQLLKPTSLLLLERCFRFGRLRGWLYSDPTTHGTLEV